MLISRLAHPVINLGHGVRAGIWTQGCSIGCLGCMARDTWPHRPETDSPPDVLARWLLSIDTTLDGVTISGGEPTEQEELPGLLAMLRVLAGQRDEQWDLLVYSGLEPDELAANHPYLAELTDAVVAGPYVESEAGAFALRGSSNQQVICHTALGRARYAQASTAAAADSLGFTVDAVRLVGIPVPGTLTEFEEGLSSAGVRLLHKSWPNDRRQP
jgi:anaerobic ribonucleoside-triphosphate reductase activating protein